MFQHFLNGRKNLPEPVLKLAEMQAFTKNISVKGHPGVTARSNPLPSNIEGFKNS